MQAPKQLGEHSFLKTSSSATTSESWARYMPTAPVPEYFSDAELHAVLFDKKEDILRENCLALDKEAGVVRLVDKETNAKQQSVTMEIVKRLGKGLFQTNALALSLPCVLFEPRSETDRLAEIWRIESFFLNKAAHISDKLERLKLVTVAEVAANYVALRKMKSFNPLLGETCQCTLADGSEVSVEQISHHPPITAYYVVGPKNCYIHAGNEEYVGAFHGNYFLFSFVSRGSLRFRDGQELTWLHRPYMKIAGLMFGDTYLVIKGSSVLYDRKNNIKVALFFDYGEKLGLISTQKSVPKDHVEGIIYVPKEGAPPTDKTTKRIADMKDVKTELARIKGSWFESVKVNDVIYWHIDKMLPLKMRHPANPLPSDFSYREDLLWLRRGNIPYADAWKDALEIRQREDRKLRETHAHAHAHADK